MADEGSNLLLAFRCPFVDTKDIAIPLPNAPLAAAVHQAQAL